MEFHRVPPSYYSVLGVDTDASGEEIRRAYHKLAMQWHPDKLSSRNPSLLGEAKQRFQQIQEAYSVLSDRRKRMVYDAGLYDHDDEEDEVEGFADFLQEMVSLMNHDRNEEKSYSTEELQCMFWEMARDFETPEWNNSEEQTASESNWFCGPFSFYESARNVERNSWEASMIHGSNSNSTFGTNSQHRLCR